MMDTRKFDKLTEAQGFLIRHGWISTNAGWLNGKGKVATIVDGKNAELGIERHFTIYVTDCDAMGFPL